MKLDKRFHLAVAKVAGQKVGECEKCYGKGQYCDYESPHSVKFKIKPCPTCAPLRELAESCWHTCNFRCLNCDEKFGELATNFNPTYTIQTIKATLEKLGEWEGFINWHDEQCATIIFQDDYSDYSECFDFGCLIDILAHADILTTDFLMLEAATNYLEGK